MSKPIAKLADDQNIRPVYELDRDDLFDVIEQITGRRPKPGSHSLTMTMTMDRAKARLTWVDIERDLTQQINGGMPVVDMSKENAQEQISQIEKMAGENVEESGKAVVDKKAK